MKGDESIEAMYSRFQTLVYGLQILKKSYVTLDHVNKILRSLLVRWRPKVTAIEEAKDLNTLCVEDLISSLKVHEIGLNEQQLSYPKNSRVLKSLYLICIVNTTDCISSVQTSNILCVIVSV